MVSAVTSNLLSVIADRTAEASSTSLPNTIDICLSGGRANETSCELRLANRCAPLTFKMADVQDDGDAGSGWRRIGDIRAGIGHATEQVRGAEAAVADS